MKFLKTLDSSKADFFRTCLPLHLNSIKPDFVQTDSL